MSSTVSLPSEMMPTPLAMALAVIGWSPVTMMTWNKKQGNLFECNCLSWQEEILRMLHLRISRKQECKPKMGKR